ncbi:hypothetical protein H8E07_16955 [bacterium]|nr:hypothetical protein [bacterium]
MKDEHTRRDPGDDIDPGEPIAELAALRETPADGFLDRVRHSVQRRLLVAQAADFSLGIFMRTMFDYLAAVLDAFRGPQPPRNGSD